MERIKSIEEFESFQSRLLSEDDPSVPTIVIPAGTCGQAAGANGLIRIAKRVVLKNKLLEQINLRITGCHGFCQIEPCVVVEPHGALYPNIKPEDMERIIEAANRGEVVEELLFKESGTGQVIEKKDDVPFFKRQVRTIMSRNEKVDPIRIFNYLGNGGYSSFLSVLAKGDPKWVVNEVKKSGLRGRGGGGFPTGLKWELLANQPNGRCKFLVCNADEGDPGAYMDRSVLEGNPHSIIEGMLIGAYATGAAEGVVYVRNEYPLAIKDLVIALRQAEEIGLLGDDIFGTGFSFSMQLIRGAGAFVCGEETALIRSIEGKMGEPRQRPPFPIEKGIDGKPTAINNVETWANIPVIMEQGAEEFSKIGTENNSGTKIFSLVGKVKYNGLVEVPMGTSIREIIYEIGGGPADNAKIKAVQTGGPSGGCIPESMFDLPIDYDSLAEAGSIMGSGGMIVLDENTCIVDFTKYFMDFLRDESCGKCFTCRKGTQRMFEILEDVSRGKAGQDQLDLLKELALVVRDSSMCGLGQSAPNPVLSALRYFRSEFIEHIEEKRCEAFVCRELVGAPCATACPLGTEAWRYIAHISREEYEEAYFAIREQNPLPSVCARVCHHPCESRCLMGTTGGEAISIRALKRFITDRIEPKTFKPQRVAVEAGEAQNVAIVGSGPAGLAAAHYLSLKGRKSTIFEAESQPGGMLTCGIPAHRLPRETLRKEIDEIIDENVTLKCNSTLGRDFSIDDLFKEGFKAVFLALGAHKSLQLRIEGRDAKGVYPSIRFLKASNLHGKKPAKGNVGVIGGGNSAIDAARIAVRQKDVESVTIYYRRTRDEMPAFTDEIEAALEEGVNLELLVSPVKISTEDGRLTGLDLIRNTLGEFDWSGRRRPIPVPGTEHTVPLDTLVVAVGENLDTEALSPMNIEMNSNGALLVDPKTFVTNLPGVFAGGDVVSGPGTVVDAIAAGKKAAVLIDQYLRGEKLEAPFIPRIPQIYVEPVEGSEEERRKSERVRPPVLSADERKRNFSEVEMTLSAADAIRESKRCLRCDLEFTDPDYNEREN